MVDKARGAPPFEEMHETLHRQILSTVSHDLKTPLATIIGALEIHLRMHDRLSPEKKLALLNSALGEAYRLDNFITNILDMAKLEAGLVNIKPERIDMKSLLNDCVTRLGPRAKMHTIRLQPNENAPPLKTDHTLFGRAIGLVLDNAIKHAGKEATIEVDYGHDDLVFFVHVRDNGPGIPEGKEEQIFSKYTRFARSDQQNAGTGLGLAICRQMMSMLGGSVTVANHSENGAIFTLRCPIAA